MAVRYEEHLDLVDTEKVAQGVQATFQRPSFYLARESSIGTYTQ